MAFDQAKAEQIKSEVCRRLSTGETLNAICRTKGYPDASTVWHWRENDPDFFQAIARARELGADAIADDTLRIADTPVEGLITKTDADGETVTREDMLGHRRLQVDTRLKLLAKWDPKRYGDRIAHDVDGKLEITVRDLAREDGEK